MPKYSEQDLQYAAEFREGIHKEALAIVRRTRPDATQVIDRHPVEDYFQESWEYPGQWYTVVAIPKGYKSRQALVDAIVRDTLAETVPDTQTVKTQPEAAKPQGDEPEETPTSGDESLDRLLAEYPDLAVDYCVVKGEPYSGYESHRRALKTAFARVCRDFDGDPGRATGRPIDPEALFSSNYREGTLNYRKAFLYPPHENGYSGKDFARISAALFPNGTDALECYEWSTDWSDYFDEGREWWGTLCLTVYDKTGDRFVVMMASATD